MRNTYCDPGGSELPLYPTTYTDELAVREAQEDAFSFNGIKSHSLNYESKAVAEWRAFRKARRCPHCNGNLADYDG